MLSPASHSKLHEVFIQELHMKFPGGKPTDFLATQLEFKDGTWYHVTVMRRSRDCHAPIT
jgi:hypothetical protein